MLEIGSVVLHHAPSLLKVQQERGRHDLFLDFPSIEGLVNFAPFGSQQITVSLCETAD